MSIRSIQPHNPSQPPRPAAPTHNPHRQGSRLARESPPPVPHFEDSPHIKTRGIASPTSSNAPVPASRRPAGPRCVAALVGRLACRGVEMGWIEKL